MNIKGKKYQSLMNLRIVTNEREAFIRICEAEGTTASKDIRGYIAKRLKEAPPAAKAKKLVA